MKREHKAFITKLSSILTSEEKSGTNTYYQQNTTFIIELLQFHNIFPEEIKNHLKSLLQACFKMITDKKSSEDIEDHFNKIIKIILNNLSKEHKNELNKLLSTITSVETIKIQPLLTLTAELLKQDQERITYYQSTNKLTDRLIAIARHSSSAIQAIFALENTAVLEALKETYYKNKNTRVLATNIAFLLHNRTTLPPEDPLPIKETHQRIMTSVIDIWLNYLIHQKTSDFSALPATAKATLLAFNPTQLSELKTAILQIETTAIRDTCSQLVHSMEEHQKLTILSHSTSPDADSLDLMATTPIIAAVAPTSDTLDRSVAPSPSGEHPSHGTA